MRASMMKISSVTAKRLSVRNFESQEDANADTGYVYYGFAYVLCMAKQKQPKVLRTAEIFSFTQRAKAKAN